MIAVAFLVEPNALWIIMSLVLPVIFIIIMIVRVIRAFIKGYDQKPK